MPRLSRWNLVVTGLILGGAPASRAMAQHVHSPTNLASPLPPVPSIEVRPAIVAPPEPAGGHCSCGTRRGLSRLRWHRTRCKRHLQDKLLGYPEEFNEWALGSSLYAHGRTQVANGLAARMVFHHNDFVDGTPRLNDRGREKLAEVAATLPTVGFPVLVEGTPKSPGLDQERRLTLLAEFGRGPFPVPAERVVVGPRIAHGLDGLESQLIYQRQLQGLGQGGVLGGGGGAAGSFDGGGLSGNAVAGGGTAR